MGNKIRDKILNFLEDIVAWTALIIWVSCMMAKFVWEYEER